MSGGDEWGPWIDHDGGPKMHGVRLGDVVHVQAIVRGVFREKVERMTQEHIDADCTSCDEGQLLRYRVRKPKGLSILQSLLENLPEQVDA